MITCPRCKNQLVDGATFCDNCGAPLADVPQPTPAAASPLRPTAGGGPTCPQCGQPVVAGDAFCENCGGVLSGSAAPPYNPQPAAAGPAAPPPSRIETQTVQPVQPSPLNEPSRLVIKTGLNSGEAFDLFQEVMSIGRESNNDIIIKDSEISRNHARISRKGGVYVLEDLGSSNGTFVNQQRLTAPRKLVAGDEIGVGTNVVVTFQGPGAAATSGGSGKLLLGCVMVAMVLCIAALAGAFLFDYLNLYCISPFDRIFGALGACKIP
jgi:uncharacterized Zn finger protein (UPF0148 family)